MNGKSLEAVATLLRWREFREGRAEDALRRRAAETLRADQRCAQAQTRVQEIHGAQDALLAAGELDLERLRALAAIEQAAWTRLQDAQAAHRTAERSQDAARQAHVAARADTRVAQSRLDRLSAQERDRAEKRQFDQMADLFNHTRGLRS